MTADEQKLSRTSNKWSHVSSFWSQLKLERFWTKNSTLVNVWSKYEWQLEKTNETVNIKNRFTSSQCFTKSFQPCFQLKLAPVMRLKHKYSNKAQPYGYKTCLYSRILTSLLSKVKKWPVWSLSEDWSSREKVSGGSDICILHGESENCATE